MITTACIGFHRYANSKEIILKLYEHFKDSLFLEVQANNTDKQKEINKSLLELSKKYKINIIAGMDSHYIYPEDSKERHNLLEAKNIKYPEEDFVERYTAKNSITMNNSDDIRDLIIAGEAAKKLDEPFITMPDNVTNIPIRETDHPEMVALKLALNAKHIDIDKYAGRFGDNYPNDKRQLKSSSATVKIIKRFCKNCDMEAILTFKDKSPDVPNPMNKEISVSLTEPFDDELSAAIFGNNNYIQSESSEFEEDDDE